MSLDGVQPQNGHSPPTSASSTPTTSSPASASLRAACSPPGPSPSTTTSQSRVDPRALMASPNHPRQDGRVTLSSRRAVLGAGLAGGAATLLAGCDSDDPSATTPTGGTAPSTAADFDPQDWDSVRA